MTMENGCVRDMEETMTAMEEGTTDMETTTMDNKEVTKDMEQGLPKVGRYEMWAESFHCDFKHRLQMGHLGNYMLNAADFHSTDRMFGMRYLNTLNKTWVLSRLCIDMEEMPEQYSQFFIETWVESAMRYFTRRNFRIEDKASGRALGYGKSVWALIDLTTRQPSDILSVNNGDIMKWVEEDKECPIESPGRVKMGDNARLVRSVPTYYSDVDVNGHINSIRYIEHILDIFPIECFRSQRLRRFDIAYVAESYYGDTLNYYLDEKTEQEMMIRITKASEKEEKEVEVVRCVMKFEKE